MALATQDSTKKQESFVDRLSYLLTVGWRIEIIPIKDEYFARIHILIMHNSRTNEQETQIFSEDWFDFSDISHFIGNDILHIDEDTCCVYNLRAPPQQIRQFVVKISRAVGVSFQSELNEWGRVINTMPSKCIECASQK